MKKNKTKKTDGTKKIFNKWIIGSLGILWILSTIFAYRALRQSLKVEEKVVENMISEKTSFNYKVEVVPCTLFPDGGIVEPNDTMYSNITKAIHLNLVSSVTSDKPITVQGSKKVVLMLIAEGLWQREFILEPKNGFNLQGNDNKVVQNDYVIDVKNIAAYIEKVEKEILISPGKYLLKVKPEIEGNVIYEDYKLPMDSTPEISFEFSGQIKLIGEREFTKETSIETAIIINQNFKLFNMKLPLMTARYVFSIASLLLFGMVTLGIYMSIKTSKIEIPEALKIDKKYNNKLIIIDKNITMLNKVNVSIKSFKALIQLSDDKEQPILRYKNSDIERVFYYVIDGDCIYSYSADDKVEDLSLLEVSTSGSGNDIKQGQ